LEKNQKGEKKRVERFVSEPGYEKSKDQTSCPGSQSEDKGTVDRNHSCSMRTRVIGDYGPQSRDSEKKNTKKVSEHSKYFGLVRTRGTTQQKPRPHFGGLSADRREALEESQKDNSRNTMSQGVLQRKMANSSIPLGKKECGAGNTLLGGSMTFMPGQRGQGKKEHRTSGPDDRAR